MIFTPLRSWLAWIAGTSGLLGGLEVTIEHYKGSYGQRVMLTPTLLSAALAGTGVAATLFRKSDTARALLRASSGAMLADGLVGFGYHVRGVHRKPGGWLLPVFNVTMGPPLFAPLLLMIGGYLGWAASDPASGESKRELGKLSRRLSAITAASAILNAMEAGYSHYKTRFSTWTQWIPIALGIPVTLIAALAARGNTLGRALLPGSSFAALLVGFWGAGLHLKGELARPGGRSQFAYNVAYGPPLLAPLLFASTGITGLIASLLGDEGVPVNKV